MFICGRNYFQLVYAGSQFRSSESSKSCDTPSSFFSLTRKTLLAHAGRSQSGSGGAVYIRSGQLVSRSSAMSNNIAGVSHPCVMSRVDRRVYDITLPTRPSPRFISSTVAQSKQPIPRF